MSECLFLKFFLLVSVDSCPDHRKYSVELVAWSPDGKQIASASFFDENIKIWDSQSGDCQSTLMTGHSKG